MWCILIFICFVLTNLSSSLPIITNNEFHHYQQIRSIQSINHNDEINLNNITNLNVSFINEDHSTSNICSTQSINIDTFITENNTDFNVQHRTSTTINTINIIQFISSWQQKIIENNDNHDDEHSTSLNIIQIIFTIPYIISNESILNKTVFIIDITHNELLANLTDICINASSFIINYSTIKPLPHNICLYLLLNLSLSTTLREIIFCRTIDNIYNDTSSLDNNNNGETNHAVGPSGFFILSQCIIIFIMMLIIYGVQTARQKNFVNRISKRLFSSRLYVTMFGNKTALRTDRNSVNTLINPATTLQAGLNQLALHRRLTLLPNQQITAPIEEQVLAASDLTSTINDRRISRPFTNRDLIDVKEFTKRISVSHENSADTEVHIL